MNKEELPATDEARGDDDNNVDDSSEWSSWYAGCGSRPALRATNAIKRNDEEELVARTVWCEA